MVQKRLTGNVMVFSAWLTILVRSASSFWIIK